MNRKRDNRRRDNAFRLTMRRYRRLKDAVESSPKRKFYSAGPNSSSTPLWMNGISTLWLFVLDTELVLYRALGFRNRREFNKWLEAGAWVPDGKRRRVGLEFVRAWLYPSKHYFPGQMYRADLAKLAARVEAERLAREAAVVK